MSSSSKTTRRTRASPMKTGKGARKSASRAPGERGAPAARAKAPARKRAAAPIESAGAPRPGAGVRRARIPPTALAPEGTSAAAEGATDPAGFFVARVRGEDAVREAPHPMAEGASDAGARIPEGVPCTPAYDERLGELPWGYGDDSVVALARDPRSLFLCWDHAGATLQRGFDGLDRPRAQLWVFARSGAGWDRVRAIDLALESHGYYVHDLDPGRTYRAEIHAVDHAGRERLLGAPSNEIALPPFGPSPVIDDRFVGLPWEQRLGGPLGPGHRRPGFPDEWREALARLSDWSRTGLSFGGSAALGGPAAGGMGGRPSSPGSGGEGEP